MENLKKIDPFAPDLKDFAPKPVLPVPSSFKPNINSPYFIESSLTSREACLRVLASENGGSVLDINSELTDASLEFEMESASNTNFNVEHSTNLSLKDRDLNDCSMSTLNLKEIADNSLNYIKTRYRINNFYTDQDDNNIDFKDSIYSIFTNLTFKIYDGEVLLYPWKKTRKSSPIFKNNCEANHLNIQLTMQKRRCVGCGSDISKATFTGLRFCYYFGKYFCLCCHDNSKCFIPAKILRKWDLQAYPVSNIAKNLILHECNNIEQWSLNLHDWNPVLFDKVRVLNEIRGLRYYFLIIYSYITENCLKNPSLAREIEKLPLHWLNSRDDYTVFDLVQIGKGNFLFTLSRIVKICKSHIGKCKLCKAKGAYCELCKSNDILFPFDAYKVCRCINCKSIFHQNCLKNDSTCPICLENEENV
ncbi:DgyrCDS6786 [Dimorphilus gyrociliatus]|uniref:DgyrCDS6786 n=1 Tax=Dimorphilus gyrociliatus TaxID=2664684 RepID=A0A7I8VQM6_9ANNE|nr:DgyrCDS6786 [Dimorphilus gyrociliatus]